jgi:hypothetical protein
LLKEQILKRLERIPEKKILKEEKPKVIEFLLNVNKQISGREKFPDRGLKNDQWRTKKSNRPCMEHFLARRDLQPSRSYEQITYLLFLKCLDYLHTLEENKSVRLKSPKERQMNIFMS